MTGTRFSMEANALVNQGNRTESSSSELKSLVMRLLEAAAPLSGKFNGDARQVFNNFKVNVNSIADQLDSALRGILRSIGEQNEAFVTHSEQASQTFSSASASANFEAAVTRNV